MTAAETMAWPSRRDSDRRAYTPTDAELDADRAAVRARVEASEQPWWPEVIAETAAEAEALAKAMPEHRVMSRGELTRRVQAWVAERPGEREWTPAGYRVEPRWHPSRHPSVCMNVAAAWRLGVPEVDVAPCSEEFSAALAYIKGHATWHAGEQRYRSLPGLVERGDALWAARGAYPWALFIRCEPQLEIPDDWWTHSRVIEWWEQLATLRTAAP